MIRLDAAKLLTKTDAHPYLKEMLSFPDYYGNNLDALFDCLTDLGPTKIFIEQDDLQGSYLEKILRVFKDACKANPDLQLLTLEEAQAEEMNGLETADSAYDSDELQDADELYDPDEPKDADAPEDADDPEDAEEPENADDPVEIDDWQDEEDLRRLDGVEEEDDPQ